MSLSQGANTVTSNLVFSMDSYNPKSVYLARSTSNILPDSQTWTTGTGGSTGYGANGSATEQDRQRRLDPHGAYTVTWRTTPDATSGADGGWNSSYYAIDTSYTYRWSVWVRRHTAGTGGTFYMGMNPAPIRNDNNTVQGNPYFTHPSQSSLTQDRWYLVVGHCFYEGYTGGRHPDTGWYENGVNIGSKSWGNIGDKDCRWNPGTTTSMHRTYHYYTTNTASGLEFAYPRVDKCDGTEPTIHELLNKSPSILYNLVKPSAGSWKSGNGEPLWRNDIGGAKTLWFDALEEWYDGGSAMLRTLNTTATIEAWIYPAAAEVSTGDRGTIVRVNGTNGGTYLSWNKDNRKISSYWHGTSPAGYHEPGPALNRQEWHHVVVVWTGTTHYHYINGVQYSAGGVTGTGTQNGSVEIGMEGTTRQFSGGISLVRVYDKALSAAEVKQNFDATRSRYGK